MIYLSVFLVHIWVQLMFTLPRRVQADSSLWLVCSYIAQTRRRLTCAPAGLEESNVAPLTPLLRPPFSCLPSPSLINRPALGALLCSQADSVWVSVRLYTHVNRCASVCKCVQTSPVSRMLSDVLWSWHCQMELPCFICPCGEEPIEDERKSAFPLRKAYSTILCFPFNTKKPSTSDK